MHLKLKLNEEEKEEETKEEETKEEETKEDEDEDNEKKVGDSLLLHKQLARKKE